MFYFASDYSRNIIFTFFIRASFSGTSPFVVILCWIYFFSPIKLFFSRLNWAFR